MNKYLILISALLITGCALNSYSTTGLNNRLELTVADLDISEPYTAEIQVVKYFGIDFERLFKKEIGYEGSMTINSSSRSNISYSSHESNGHKSNSMSINNTVSNMINKIVRPIIGSEASVYAYYKLLDEHPNYDFVLYPRIEERRSGIPFVMTTTNIKMVARLGKLK